MQSFYFVLALPLVASVAMAQATDANATYGLVPPTAAQVDSPTASFTANAPGEANLLFENGWYYRVAGDANEIPFSDDGTMTVMDPGGLGPRISVKWADVDNRGLLSARQDIFVYSTGASQGVALNTMSLTNIGTAPVVVDVFNYADIDLCNLAADVAVGAVQNHDITEGACQEFCSFSGLGADRTDMGPFAGAELGLTTPGLTVLANTLGFGPGDYSGAFQWTNRTIGPGQCVTFQEAFTHNRPAGRYAEYERYGVCTVGTNAAGVAGHPCIAASDLALADLTNAAISTFDVELSNAPANAASFFLVSIGRGFTPLLPGIIVCVDLPSAVTLFQLTDAAGDARTTMTVPPNAVYVGLVLNFQYLVADPTARNGLGTQTCCLEMTVGAQ